MYNPTFTYGMKYTDYVANALNTGENTNQTLSTTNQERDWLDPIEVTKRIDEHTKKYRPRRERLRKREQLEQLEEWEKFEKPKRQSKQGGKRVSWNLCLERQARLENMQQQGGTQEIDGKAGNISTKDMPWYNSTILEVEFAHRLQQHLRVPITFRWNSYRTLFSRRCIRCIRCKRYFDVSDEEEYADKEICVFHWGKFEERYTCCGRSRDLGYKGCESCEWHEWDGGVYRYYGNRSLFWETEERSDKSTGTNKVLALDCELRYTRGFDVTKVSLVNYDGDVVYNVSVGDTSDILSNSTPSDFWKQPHKKPLDEVREDLLDLICADTILIGHGVRHNLNVFQIEHTNIFDTTCEFPHPAGHPYRHSLKTMAKKYLHRDIQCKDTGNDSLENARAALDIVKLMVHNNMLRKSFYECIS